MLDDLFKEPSPLASKDLEADEIILIADRSGSMNSIQNDAEGGINSFIKEQQKEGNANLTLIEFDDAVDVVYKQTDVKEAKDYKLEPRGFTALYDAIGLTLANAESIKTTGKKIVVIVTDGGENSSKEWSREMVFERINSLKEAGWEFLFLAANQDAMDTGTSMGISAGSTVTFNATADGARSAYNVAANYVSSSRGAMRSASVQELEDALADDVEANEELSQ